MIKKSDFKTLFIEPKEDQDHVYRNWGMPRGILYLATILHVLGYHVNAYVESLIKEGLFNNDKFMRDFCEADVVFISLISTSAASSFRIAGRLREMRPDITIVMGGPHASARPEECLEYCDVVSIGFDSGYVVIKELAEAFSEDKTLSEIKGLAYNAEGGIYYTDLGRIGTYVEYCALKPEERRPPLTQKEYDEVPAAQYELIYNYKAINTVPASTGQGCSEWRKPCTFCASAGKPLCRPIPIVMEELRNIQRLFGKWAWVFITDNQFITKRSKHALPLAKAIAESELNLHFVAQARANSFLKGHSLDPDVELLTAFKDAGFEIWCLGLEAAEQSTLDLIHKNITLEQMEAGIKALHDYDMRIMGMMIMGLDTDTLKSFRIMLEFVMRNKVDAIQVLAPFPLPGTPLFDQVSGENRILLNDWPKDWSSYNGHNVIIDPQNMAPITLLLGTLWIIWKFYSPVRTGKALLPHLSYIGGLLRKETELRAKLPPLLYYLWTDRGEALRTMERSLDTEDYEKLVDMLWEPMIRTYGFSEVLRWCKRIAVDGHLAKMLAISLNIKLLGRPYKSIWKRLVE